MATWPNDAAVYEGRRFSVEDGLGRERGVTQFDHGLLRRVQYGAGRSFEPELDRFGNRLDKGLLMEVASWGARAKEGEKTRKTTVRPTISTDQIAPRDLAHDGKAEGVSMGTTGTTSSILARWGISRSRDEQREREVVSEGHFTAESLGRCSSNEARALLPFEVAARLPALPLGVDLGGLDESGANRNEASGVVTCAVPVGLRTQLEGELRFALGRTVRLVEVATEVLQEAIVLAYHGDDTRLAEAAQKLAQESRFESGAPTISFRPESGDAARFLATLLEYAVAKGASDLHLIPKRDGGHVRLRIDGELHSRDDRVCPSGVFSQLITRLKVLSRLDIGRHGVPQDGAFVIPRDGATDVPARVSILPTLHGEKGVVRFLSTARVAELKTLGLSPALLDELGRFCQRRDGSVLFAGPTGSGKSTSIYALLHELGRRNKSVVSIEDPVEVEVRGISQTSLSEAHGLDYPAALRAVLRQDPDVIALGEIRDQVSAEVAFQAALTGHLVVSTVHARRVWEVPARLAQLGLDRGTVAQALRLIVCQRLIPLLCRWCKVIDLHASNKIGACIYREVGCARCDYAGVLERRVIAEFLAPSPELAERIAAGERLRREDMWGERSEILEATLKQLIHDGFISAAQGVGYAGDW